MYGHNASVRGQIFIQCLQTFY